MKKIELLLIIALFFCTVPILSQEGHKLNTGIDASFGLHYFNSDKNNPVSAGISVGYEYDIIFFFGIEAGFRFGGFNQKVNFDTPTIGMDDFGKITTQSSDVYRGTYWAPYIAPKIYLPIGYDENQDRPRFIYIENRLSYGRTSLNVDKITNMTGSAHKYGLQYEFRAGYQFPVSERWAINCWLGYNTFDFSRVNPEIMKFKNSTPIQLGIGFNYILKQ